VRQAPQVSDASLDEAQVNDASPDEADSLPEEEPQQPAPATETEESPDTAQRRQVILFIGDGMQLHHEIAASRYLTGTDQGLSFHDFPYQNSVTTWDSTTYNQYAGRAEDSVFEPDDFDPTLGYDPKRGGTVPHPRAEAPDEDYFLASLPLWPTSQAEARPATDSASSATALATGHKTEKGNIAWAAGDQPLGRLYTLAELARWQRGAAIGVVSTVPFSHATPASFVSHNTNRSNYGAIADEIIFRTRPDVVIGGGHPDWVESFRYITAEAYEELQSGFFWHFVERQAGTAGGEALLRAATDAVDQRRPLFGLFGVSNFESPVPHHGPGRPEVTAGSMENPSLAQATQAALTVLSEDPDGFFVMIEQGDIDWANHANDYRRMVGTTLDLHDAVRAAVEFVNRDSDAVDWTNTLLIVTADHANSYMRLDSENQLGRGELPEDLSPYVHYSTDGHTNELVSLYATGAGLEEGESDLFSQFEGQWYENERIIDNTHIFAAMADFLGVTP
jgi:alkaline phosphatase